MWFSGKFADGSDIDPEAVSEFKETVLSEWPRGQFYFFAYLLCGFHKFNSLQAMCFKFVKARECSWNNGFANCL